MMTTVVSSIELEQLVTQRSPANVTRLGNEKKALSHNRPDVNTHTLLGSRVKKSDSFTYVQQGPQQK